MASEIVHLSYDQINMSTSTIYSDRRVTVPAGTLTATNWFQLTNGSYDTNVTPDDAEQSVNPVAGSQVWAGTYSILTAFGSSLSRMHVAFDSTATQGVVVLGTFGTTNQWNAYVDATEVDAAYVQSGTVTNWGYKTPIWMARNGISGQVIPAGSHTFDMQNVAGFFQQFYAVASYDGAINQRRVLIIGDSFSQNARSFIWHLRNNVRMHFPQSDLRFYSFDQSGRATADLLASVSHGLTTLDGMLMAYSPALVVYVLGRNDGNGTSTTASLYNVTTNAAATGLTQAWGPAHNSNMNSVLNLVKSYGAQLAWYCPVNVGFSEMHFTNGARDWAYANNVPFRDAGLVVGQNSNLISSTHPTPSGNEVLGQDMFLWFADNYRWLIG